MMINKLIYLIAESFKSISRSLLPSIISSLTIAVSLVVLSVSYFLYTNLQDYTTELKDEYNIDVFFNNDLDLTKALDVFNKILLFDGIEDGTFIDKDAASLIFKEEFNEDIVKIIGSNPLPMGATYGVSKDFRTYENMKNITNSINGIAEVDEAMFPKDPVVKFDRMSRNILSFSFLIGLFIMFISLFFVSNTILLVVYSKKLEIKTLNLLGASKIFIKFPYILEGIILGFFGSLLSLGMLFGLYKLSVYVLEPYYINTSISYLNIILMNFIFGCLLGLIGSSKALSSNIIK